MKRFSGMALVIGMGALVLTGCGGDGLNSGVGDPSAPGYSSLRSKDAIFIAHHYPKDTCENLKNYNSDYESYYTNKKEYHCKDYGRVDDTIKCGEDDLYNKSGITDISDCIIGGDDMVAGKKVGKEDTTPSFKTIFSDML